MNNYRENCYELTEQLDQLKDENDELKVQNIKYMNGNIGYQLKNSLYKQTLTEIKEFFNEECIICKENYINITGEICEECKYKDILQKISEVEYGI